MTDFSIIGKVKGSIETKTTETGLEVSNIFVEARRNFRSKDKDYEIDLYQITMFKTLTDEVKSELKDGDKVIIKGHFTANNSSNKERNYYFCNLVADRVEFISEL